MKLSLLYSWGKLQLARGFSPALALTVCSSLFSAPTGDPRLLDAVKRRDPKAVESLLKQRADRSEEHTSELQSQ